ncbi:hypothetical protein K501DRAFT_336557 [Backusella circina FSU 941]|nr:hypothetical protein K501DRAFT_336557 [Backusella circina FSU 941]
MQAMSIEGLDGTKEHIQVKVRTIQRWLSKLLNISTSESRVSIRSIASSLALQAGIPKDDIVSMGNWSNSTTFENYYCREHLSTFGFTNTLLTLDEDDDNNSDDIFFDALE